LDRKKEKELCNWLKLTWDAGHYPAAVLRTYIALRTGDKGRKTRLDWSKKVHEEGRIMKIYTRMI